MGEKKKKYSSPKITTIRVRNAADFLTKSEEEILQFLKERVHKDEKTQKKRMRKK